MAAVPARAEAVRAADRRFPEAVRWLERWLQVPSISAGTEHRADVRRATTLLARRLRGCGAAVEVRRTAAGRPVLLARCRGRSPRALVVYGHLDVKPAGPGWSSPAFRPRREGDRLIARGASDDKGQLFAHVLATEAWLAAGGLPSDVVWIVESAEEIGSPGLGRVLAEARRSPLLAGPITGIVVSDTRMAAPGVPSLTVSQRGMLSVSVRVDAGGPAVHAGRLGGAVLDPGQVLAGAVQRLAATVDSWRAQGVPAFSPVPDRDVRTEARGRAVHPGRLGARTTVCGAVSVTSLRADGPPGAVPSTATAELDVRLPAGIGPADARAAVTAALTGADRPPLRTTVRFGAGAPAFVADHPAQTLAALDDACRAGFGKAPVVRASGGTIPAVLELRKAFGLAPVLLGLGPVDDGAHGPDEYLDLADLRRGVRTCVALIENLAKTGAPKYQANDALTLVDR